MDRTEKIEKTLNSLDGIGKAKANPFLFEKTLNRMKSSSQKSFTINSYAWKLAAVVFVIALLNVFTYLAYPSDSNSTAVTQTSYETNLKSFVKEYSIYNTYKY